MRALVQRVSRASVRVNGEVRGSIGQGFLVLLGVGDGDDEAIATSIARKVATLRVFEDGAGKMNVGLAESGGAVLCISQFTLYGDVRRGNRPSFTEAAPPERARELYELFCSAIRAMGIPCEEGVFRAHMEVELVNDGPVTLMIDSEELRRPRRA
jgi:D-aminoacyl-tRNA deacylase